LRSTLRHHMVGMCNSEVNDLMVLIFICLLLVWTAKDIVYSGEQESRIEKLVPILERRESVRERYMTLYMYALCTYLVQRVRT
jgi:hypothetical protein